MFFCMLCVDIYLLFYEPGNESCKLVLMKCYSYCGNCLAESFTRIQTFFNILYFKKIKYFSDCFRIAKDPSHNTTQWKIIMYKFCIAT